MTDAEDTVLGVPDLIHGSLISSCPVLRVVVRAEECFHCLLLQIDSCVILHGPELSLAAGKCLKKRRFGEVFLLHIILYFPPYCLCKRSMLITIGRRRCHQSIGHDISEGIPCGEDVKDCRII